jgi:hypothetical protein
MKVGRLSTPLIRIDRAAQGEQHDGTGKPQAEDRKGSGPMLKTDTEAKVIYSVFLGSLAIFGVLAYGIWSWRVSSFPHVVATITEVWDEKIRYSGRGSLIAESVFKVEPRYKMVTFGRITFMRHKNGTSHECERIVELGVPTDGYAVGQHLDVVPATGTCQRVDVIKRLP